MCGVFGFQYNPEDILPWQQRSVIAMLLALEIEPRGRDASGYAYFDAATGETMYRKDDNRYSLSCLMPDTVGATNLIGHTRFATVGAKTRENAHPWHIGHLVGAHNGGIFNYRNIEKQYPDRKYDVDSMHLIRHIADDLDTEELEGYGTVEWFDTRDPGAIFLCAMNRGDLHIEVLAEGKGVVWASTRSACSTALNAVEMYKKSKSLTVKENTVYRVANGVIAETDRVIKLKTAYKKASSPSHTGYNGSRWVQGSDGVWRDPTAIENKGLPFGCTAVTTPRIIDNMPSQDGAAEYVAAVASYEKELARIMGGAEAGLTRRQRRRMEKLLTQTEEHRPECHCTFCMEIFRLAASGT